MLGCFNVIITVLDFCDSELVSLCWDNAPNYCPTRIHIIPYIGKLLREKTFANFEVLWLFAKVFFCKLWRRGIFWWHSIFWWQKWAILESFLCESRTFYHFAKVFSLESFPLSGIAGYCIAIFMVVRCVSVLVWSMLPLKRYVCVECMSCNVVSFLFCPWHCLSSHHIHKRFKLIHRML